MNIKKSVKIPISDKFSAVKLKYVNVANKVEDSFVVKLESRKSFLEKAIEITFVYSAVRHIRAGA